MADTAPLTGGVRASFAKAVIKAKEGAQKLTGNDAVSLAAQFVASVVLLIAISVKDENHPVNFGYTLFVAIVGGVFSLLGMCYMALVTTEKTLFSMPIFGEMTPFKILQLFLAVWWGIGLGFITFRGPFPCMGNGYFAVWIGAFAALFGLGVTLPRLKAATASHSPYLLGLIACSVVLGLALAIPTAPSASLACYTQPTSNQTLQPEYGFIVAVLSFFIGLVALLHELSSQPLAYVTSHALFITQALLWGAAAAWLTFDYNPTKGLNNGYVAIWGGFICASRLATEPPPAPEVAPEAEPDEMAPVRERSPSMIEKVLTNQRLASMWGMFAAGVVLLMAVVSEAETKGELWGYALSVAIVGSSLALISAMLAQNELGSKPLFADDKFNRIAPGVAANWNGVLAVLMFLWWGVGTCVLTIHGKVNGGLGSMFTVASAGANGYFAAWIGFGCSLVSLGMTAENAKTAKDAAASQGITAQLALLACALLIIVDVSPLIADYPHACTGAIPHACTGAKVYALVVAIITVLRVLVTLFLGYFKKPMPELVEKILAVTRFIKWVILASWCTFDGPFEGLGNGYFASWGGVLCAVALLITTFVPPPPAQTESAPAADDPSTSPDTEAGGVPGSSLPPYEPTYEPTVTAQQVKPGVDDAEE